MCSIGIQPFDLKDSGTDLDIATLGTMQFINCELHQKCGVKVPHPETCPAP